MKALFLVLFLLFAGTAARASGDLPQRAAFDQHLQRRLPLELNFRAADGRTVPLSRFFHGKPVVLALAYYECPNLCTIVLNALLNGVCGLRPSAGKDFEIVIVSIDPRETPVLAAQKKQAYVRRYERPEGGAGWHFLTGEQDSIARLAAAIGYHYFYDEASKQFAHPSGIVIATPDGRISQYILGIEFPPAELDAGLKRAASGGIGTLARNLLLLCFHYDPSTGKYSLLISRVLQVAGGLTVAGIIGLAWSLERRRRAAEFP